MAAAESDAKESRRLKAAKARFATFLSNHPLSEIVEVKADPRSLLAIRRPWGDGSLALYINDKTRAKLAEALNNVLLPSSLRGLYHRDTRRIEIIWTALKLSDDQAEIAGREFELRRGPNVHKCTFGRSSDRLLTIARGFILLTQSESNWRNLTSFKNYDHRDDDDVFESFDEPRSFWIDNVDWNDDTALDLIRTINFYMVLYDYSSPTVVIEPDPDPLQVNPRSRYLWDMFPQAIAAAELEPNLVSYWSAAHDATSLAEKFLNFYRIIEYVAYHHVEYETRRAIKRVMASPHLTSALDKSADEVIALIREFRVQYEGDRVAAVVKETVKPALIWKEVCVNPDYFTSPVAFEGGLELDKIANSATDKSDIPAQLVTNVTRSLTKIRNALAHGKDKMTGDVILPTRLNMIMLEPWVHLISAIAAEVLLYEKLD